MTAQNLQSARPAIGPVQGLLLLALYRAVSLQVWPATNPFVFAPLVTASIFVPLIAISGLGNMRLDRLLGWLGIAIVLCGGLSFYDIFRDPTDMSRISDHYPNGFPRDIPSVQLWLLLAGLLFVAHALVLSSAADRRLFASYTTYFDVSWKHGVQAILSALFVGVFWGILFLGASLFSLIKINFLSNLIGQDYFWIPATALATGYALHLTDIRAGLTRGARTLVLFLLSWLLPIMTLLAVGFIMALPFAGLEALWSTKRAGTILLGSAAMLVFLINTSYQDGQTEQSAILRWSRLVASVVLLPLVALSVYALMLRVQQYGFTPERVIYLALTAIAAFYALGYLYAAGRYGLPLRGLEPVNLITALVIIVIGLALLTPVADPLRISVNDQIARLNAGKVAPEQFDFVFLKFDAGRYGRSALATLAGRTGNEAAQAIAQRASLIQAQKQRYQASQTQRVPSPDKRAAQIKVVVPDGGALPASFLSQSWGSASYAVPPCLTGTAECDAMLLDLDGDGRNEIILLTRPNGLAAVFTADGDGWKLVGPLLNSQCSGVRDALRGGRFELQDPAHKEIVANGQRLRISETGCTRQ